MCVCVCVGLRTDVKMCVCVCVSIQDSESRAMAVVLGVGGSGASVYSSLDLLQIARGQWRGASTRNYFRGSKIISGCMQCSMYFSTPIAFSTPRSTMFLYLFILVYLEQVHFTVIKK